MKRAIKGLIKFTDDYQNKEEIILRDHLSMERTKLANERTLLSYLRTSLYLVLGGIAFLGMKDLAEIRNLGYFALALSIILFIIGIARFYELKKHLKIMYVPFLSVSTKDSRE
jgi:putative membrane protein